MRGYHLESAAYGCFYVLRMKSGSMSRIFAAAVSSLTQCQSVKICNADIRKRQKEINLREKIRRKIE